MKPPLTLARGQTLVLFAVSLLLVTLMVTMTLSFSTKAREKMELQQVADQAAYSNSIVTARTFNSVALLNRVQVSTMVAIAGIQAAASYAALFRSYLMDLQQIYTIFLGVWASACGASLGTCSCCCNGIRDYTLKLTIIDAQLAMAIAWWEALDTATGIEAGLYQAAGLTVSGFQQSTFSDLTGQLSGQSLAGDIVRHASNGSAEWSVTGGPSGINRRETGDVSRTLGVYGAAMQAFMYPMNMTSVYAAMASRGNPWVAGRFLEGGGLQRRMSAAVLPGLDNFISITPNGFIGQGSAYFGAAPHVNASWFTTTDTGVWADDHAMGTLMTRGGCWPLLPVPMQAWAMCGAGWTSWHFWLGTLSAGNDLGPRHFLMPLSGSGVWPPFIDYNFAKLLMQEDAYGQPKNFAVINRDYRLRPTAADPWNLFFNFRMSSSGPGEDFGQGRASDPNAIILQDGTDISRQTALSTGIVYYHRYGHWKEPPNLFNPFWRAGLSRMNIDPKPMDGTGRDWFEDVEEALNNSGAPWAADAVQPLVRAGYQGFQ